MSVFFTKTSINDYAKLCDTDIMGLTDRHYKHDEDVYENFK